MFLFYLQRLAFLCKQRTLEMSYILGEMLKNTEAFESKACSSIGCSFWFWVESFPGAQTVRVHKIEAWVPAVWTLSIFPYSVQNTRLKGNKQSFKPNFKFSRDKPWCVQRSGVGNWSTLARSKSKCAVTLPCRGMSYPSGLNQPV